MDRIEIEANGVVFRCLASGPSDGPLALLAHGFPDSMATWRHLHAPLGDAGYHVVSPAMRGYAPSDVPADGNYQGAALAVDLIELTDALGGDGRSVVIGHDWGAIAAYGAAALAPDRWRAMVTLAVPPPGAMARAFGTTAQLKRSWYVFFFQTRGAELMVGRGDLELLTTLWHDWSPGYDATEDLDALRSALDTPERVSAAVGYYRSMFDRTSHDPRLADAQGRLAGPQTIPTLYLHGARDGCLALDSIGDPRSLLAEGSRFEVIEDAGHFLHLERPERTATEILGFLGAAR
jgi:pimeloyl-ACP methyl ester carboxylesterase